MNYCKVYKYPTKLFSFRRNIRSFSDPPRQTFHTRFFGRDFIVPISILTVHPGRCTPTKLQHMGDPCPLIDETPKLLYSLSGLTLKDLINLSSIFYIGYFVT